MTWPETPVERVFFWAAIAPFAVYFAGLGAFQTLLLAWPVIAIAAWFILRDGCRPPPLAVLWSLCMLGLLIQQLVTLYMRGVGGSDPMWWVLSYGLAAFLPLAGGLIRPQLIGSAAAILGCQALAYCVIAWLAFHAGFHRHYQILPAGLSGVQDFIEVRLGWPEPVPGGLRLSAFCTYAPLAGATACYQALMTLLARNSGLKWLGLAGWLLLLFLTFSRMALIAAAVAVVVYVALAWGRRYFVLTAGVALLAVAALAGPLVILGERATDFIHAQRQQSSLDRSNMRTIAMDEWRFGGQQILGVGEMQPGGDIVNKVPIGNLDSLSALLFVRGALGICLILLPLVVTWFFGLVAGVEPLYRIVGSIATALLLFTYSQRLQDLYMYNWSILILIGAAFYRDRASAPQPAAAVV
jgi:hypothetical protein